MPVSTFTVSSTNARRSEETLMTHKLNVNHDNQTPKHMKMNELIFHSERFRVEFSAYVDFNCTVFRRLYNHLLAKINNNQFHSNKIKNKISFSCARVLTCSHLIFRRHDNRLNGLRLL